LFLLYPVSKELQEKNESKRIKFVTTHYAGIAETAVMSRLERKGGRDLLLKTLEGN
jgi:hypothetical protein